jgi:K+-sensing histidine kinase KdpD
MTVTRPGHLRVFLGMAAGVGKTFRMLLEGHEELEAGSDVAIGLLETHGRAETAAVAEGLPIIPRRRITYRDTKLEEMDLPGILTRTGAHRLVRRAWRSAQRLGAQLDVLWISPPSRSLSDDQERSLSALRHLASILGAHFLIEESDSIPEAIAEVAHRRRNTYVLLGRSRPARGLARLRTPLPQRLMELLPGVDVRIVADRSRRAAGESE